MLDYLKKFNDLPKELRDKISSVSVMAVISDLETKYQLDLAAIVMEVMIKQLSFKDLEVYFVSQHLLKAEAARKLTEEMISRVFSGVSEYLGIEKEVSIKPDSEIKSLVPGEIKKDSADDYNLDDLIKEVGLTFSSEALRVRFKNIILTYFKGIRTRIDTRATLAKEFSLGGVNLEAAEIDRVFFVGDRRLKQHNSLLLTSAKPLKQLDKIILQSARASGEEYDLKKALAVKKTQDKLSAPVPSSVNIFKSTTKLASTLDTSHELNAPAVMDSGHKLMAAKSFLDTSHELNAPQELEEITAPHVNLAISQPLIKKQATEDHKKNSQEKLSVLLPSLSPAKPAASLVLPKSSISASPISTINNRPLPPSPVYSANKPTISNTVIAKPKELKIPPTFRAEEKPAQVSNSNVVKTPITPIIPKILTTPVIPITSVIPKTPAAPVVPKVSITPAAPVVPKVSVTPVVPKIPVTPAAQKISLAAARTTTIPGSGFGMHDMKPMPKVMGPLEELRFLDLVNFRRLGKTPEDSILKILSKIKLLEKDGYDRLVSGVKAWRQSPINRLYLRLGQEAVVKGKSFKEIVEEHQQTGSDNLNMKEIEAIVSLNSKLIF